MKIGDRVKLSNDKRNTKSIFWKNRNINHNSVGIVEKIANPGFKDRLVIVKWGNGEESICHIDYLELHDGESIPLPNLRFKNKKVNQCI